jgi:hypothetical protein
LKEPNIPESNAPDEEHAAEEEDKEEKEEDDTLNKEEKRRKARLRTRGPYRKAHANW